MASTTSVGTSKSTTSSPSPMPNWADQPLPLISTPLGQIPLSKAHASLVIAHNMAQLHNMMLRNINSIYQQAPFVKDEQDVLDLVGFTKFWYDMLHHHHSVEEEMFFPGVEELTGENMQVNVEQHRAFDAGLDAILTWTQTVTPETYDANVVRDIIDAMGPPLARHLSDEIGTLLALKQYDSAPLLKLWEKTGEVARAKYPMNVAVPLLIGSYDATYEGKAVSEFDMPYVMQLLNKLILRRKYAGIWRFLPCDFNSTPRPLAFVPTA